MTESSQTKVLGIIPARGGSKGIPRKNLALLAGRPLIYYTIRAAQSSRRLTRLIVSTEDREIRSVASSLAVDVPFVRPDHLATDHASVVDVVKHALQSVEKSQGVRYDIVCLLQPTCPLRTPQDIDRSIDTLQDSDADAVISLARVDDPHPHKMMLIADGTIEPLFPVKWHPNVRRQDLPPVYYLNGGIYCVRSAALWKHNSLWGAKALPHVMPAGRSVNIDSILDLRVAEAVLTSSAGTQPSKETGDAASKT